MTALRNLTIAPPRFCKVYNLYVADKPLAVTVKLFQLEIQIGLITICFGFNCFSVYPPSISKVFYECRTTIIDGKAPWFFVTSPKACTKC